MSSPFSSSSSRSSIHTRITRSLFLALVPALLLSACGPGGPTDDDRDEEQVDDAGPSDAGAAPDDAGAPGDAGPDPDGGTTLDDGGAPSVPEPGEPQGTPAELAAAITSGGATDDVVAATRHVLARAGVATVDDDVVRVAAFPPVASATVTSTESFKLALEARGKTLGGRATATEVAEMLADLGWPFHEDTPPGAQLLALLARWIEAAHLTPDDEGSFIPLFLEEMVARQLPPVGALADASPDLVRFTLLELQLLAAAFDRVLPHDAGARMGAFSTSPCSDFKKQLGVLGEIGGVAASEVVSAGLSEGLSAAGVSASDVDAFGKGMTALGSAAKVWKLMALYASAEVAVSVDSSNPLHKPAAAEAPLFSSFTARAGVSEADWEAYQAQRTEAVEAANRVVRDCLSSVGLPTLADLGEIANDAASWRVRWRLPEGSPEHAFISLDNNDFYLPGQLAMQLSRQGPYSAAATLVVDLTHEKGREHRGYESQAPVTARAEVDTTQPPSLGTLVNAMKGGLGLIDSIVEVAAGWYQEMAPPKAYATLTVTFHEAPKYRVRIWETYTLEGDGGTVHWNAAYVGTLQEHVCGDGVSAETIACYQGEMEASASQMAVSACTFTYSQDARFQFRDEVRRAGGGEVLIHQLPIRTYAGPVDVEHNCPAPIPPLSELALFGTWDVVPELPLPRERGQKTVTQFKAMNDIVDVDVELEAL